ncbi:site-specific integrase [Arthrobacter frigidicola]|nr:site-specific integrase [Arthrobacter frigidicola]
MRKIYPYHGKTKTTYRVIYSTNGVRAAETFDTEAEAIMFNTLLDRHDGNGARALRLLEEARGEGPTLAESMRAHVDQLIGVGPGTLKRYRTSIDQHFSRLGLIKTARLTQADIKHWVQEMEANGYTAKTILNHKGFLAAALNTAVNHQIISHNPAKGVKVGAGMAHEEPIRYITGDQWKLIIENMAPHYRPFFQFLLATGMRFGEATALVASDFDLTQQPALVRVSKAWKENGSGGHVLGPPKTRKGRRTVSVPGATVELILPLIQQAGTGLVFTNTLGGRILSSAAHKIWGPACLKAGFTAENKPRIHDIRHTSASILLRQGLDMYQLSRRLGHANIQMSIDKYSDLMPDAHFNSADIATQALEAF